MSKKEFEFTLLLTGVKEITTDLEDQLFEAGCDDSTLSTQKGIVHLDFNREAPSLEEAIISAIKAVESIDLGIKVGRVEPGDLVTSSEMGRRLGFSREYIRLLINGERGNGGFPNPVSGATGKTAIWSWTEVLHWINNEEKGKYAEALRQAETIQLINKVLVERLANVNSYRLQHFRNELQHQVVEQVNERSGDGGT